MNLTANRKGITLTKNNILKQLENKEIDVFQAIYLLESTIENKKNEGVVYTPKYIADYIVKNIDYKITETIFEPSCGHGVFIFSLIEYVKSIYKLTENELIEWFNKKVYTCELSTEKTKEFKELLAIYFNNNEALSFENIKNFDTLKLKFEKKFDVLIGNPPYIRTKHLEKADLDYLRNNFISCTKGNVDIYYAFIEYGLRVAKRSSMIVPNSFITNKSAENLRTIIKPYISEITDFKSELIFSPVRTYTAIYKLTDEKSNEIKYANNLNDEKISFDKNNLPKEQWLFDNIENNKLFPENIEIKSGIATLKDKVFIIQKPEYVEKDNKIYVMKEYNNHIFLIEKERTLILYKGTKNEKDLLIINPYDENFKIIPENVLMKEAPKMFKFLKHTKNELLLRDKGKTEKYEAWYAYGRKQGLFKNEKEFHLLLPLMTTLPLKPKLIKKVDNFLFVSGYLISCETEEEIRKIQKIIESEDFSSYIKKSGKEWPGNEKPYYSYSVSLLKNL